MRRRRYIVKRQAARAGTGSVTVSPIISGSALGGAIPDPVTSPIHIEPSSGTVAIHLKEDAGIYSDDGFGGTATVQLIDWDSVAAYICIGEPNATAPNGWDAKLFGKTEVRKLEITGDASGLPFFRVRNAADTQDTVVVLDEATGTILAVQPSTTHPEAVPYTSFSVPGQTGDVFTAWDSSAVVRLFRVLAGGAAVIGQTAAPADADLDASQCALWFDATNGAAKIKFKGKTANGTVVTGQVALA